MSGVDTETDIAYIESATEGKRPNRVTQKDTAKMEHFKNMPLVALVEMAKHATDPVQFGKDLLSYIGAELSTSIRAEMTARIEAHKEMSKGAKVLQIGFDG